ncbi:MAG TPA: hypothetical protein VFZ53_07095, partial [Polyangiaceae bacterium]
ELPARVVVFLRAAGMHPPLRAALEAGGYGPSDHAEGVRLLAAACPYRDGGLDPADDAEAREAVAELERWAKRHLARLRAALERLHPDVRIVPEANGLDGANAVLAVATLLGRVRELERANERDARKPSGAVLETLTRRGFDAAMRARLGELVEVAQRADAPNGVSAGGVETETDDAPDAEIVALHAWFEDWASTARALVERKDWLIRLGLRERPRRRPAGIADGRF